MLLAEAVHLPGAPVVRRLAEVPVELVLGAPSLQREATAVRVRRVEQRLAERRTWRARERRMNFWPVDISPRSFSDYDIEMMRRISCDFSDVSWPDPTILLPWNEQPHQ